MNRGGGRNDVCEIWINNASKYYKHEYPHSYVSASYLDL